MWPSIMACSQCSDIMVSLKRGYRPLVWLARVIRRGRGLQHTNSISAKWRESTDQSERWTTKTDKVLVGQLVVRRRRRGQGESKGKMRDDTL